MYRIIFFLCIFFMGSNIYALDITSQSVKQAPQRGQQNIFGEINPQFYVDFWEGIQATKKQHSLEIFPDFYEGHFYNIPEKTPEYIFLEHMLWTSKMKMLTSIGYDSFVLEKRNIRPIRLFQNSIASEFAHRNPEKGLATNIENTLYYQINSPKAQTISVKVFPATDKDHVLFYNWEYETFSFDHPYRLKLMHPELTTQQERDEYVKKQYQFPIISMLDPSMDIYDLSLKTSQDGFQTIHTPTARKMKFTHFGKKFIPPMGSDWDLQLPMLQDTFTLLPYYETQISVPKGTSTIVISYKNLQMTDGTLVTPISIEK